MARFLDDEELLIECINDTLDDMGFQQLNDGIEGKDAKAAFEAAHSLKGICGNVGLTPLFEIISPLVEILRRDSLDNVEIYFNKLMEEKNKII